VNRPIANLQAAAVLLETLQRLGMVQVVLCPGSRSAPLALAAGGLARAGLIRLTTAVDERSAAFLALGSATARGRATAVITTSGTAVANLLPAAVEADRSSQPLLLLTADRPTRLKDCGANQTVNQETFLRPVCRWMGHGPNDGLDQATPRELQALAKEAWDWAHDCPGPVHLNLAFEEPLHPSTADQQTFWSDWGQRPSSVSDTSFASIPSPPIAPLAPPALRLDPDRPGVVVAGPWRGLADQHDAWVQALLLWQQRSGWPVLADPLAALPMDLPGLVRGWDLLLPGGLPLLSGIAREELQVLRLGPLPASRRLEHWLRHCPGPQLLITESEPRSLDPLQKAQQWSGGLARWPQLMLDCAEPSSSPSPSQQLCRIWQQRDRELVCQLEQFLPRSGPVSEPALMQALSALLPKNLPLMLAASSPVRDWQAFALQPDAPCHCFSFRGASGIDGTLSLGFGLASVLGRTLLITGDLALLHDSNGWLFTGMSSEAPPLLVLLIDNAGGGIFQQLPVPAMSAEAFDDLFAMPQAVNPLALAAAHGVPGRQVAALDDLASALEWGLAQAGPALIRVRTDRSADADRRRALRSELQARTMAPPRDDPR